MIETFFILSVCYVILFLTSIKLQDNSIADVFWGAGFVIISLLLFFFESEKNIAQILTLVLISVWGIRLFSLFISRKLRKNGEDPRYAQWRESWKYFYTRSFFQVYLLQMLLMLIIAIPLFFIFTSNEINIPLLLAGTIIAIAGLSIEVTADKQVKHFLQNKKKGENIVYTGGLYKYSRNPNYFGESTFWLGISIISLPISLAGILGYLMITFLLLKVSGVPMKEKSHSKKDNWHPYLEKTNKFIPWFPKS